MLRLKGDQSLVSATATLRGVQPQIRAGAMPENWPPQFQSQFLNQPLTLRPADTGTSALRQQYSRLLLVVFVIVGLVLIIACGNVANLVLARTTARRHELSVRVALGASRWRLARQWLVESVLLAAVATVVGSVWAVWSSRALVAALSTSVERVFLDFSVDWRMLTFTAALAVATAVLFGTAPAVRAARVAPIEALKTHGADTSGATGANVAGWLVAAQIALSLMLVVGAGLFAKTFERLATLPLGFDADRVLVARVNATRSHVDTQDLIPFYYRLADIVAAVPGVTKAAASALTPVEGNPMVDVVNLPGEPPTFELFHRGAPAGRTAAVNYVTPDWFATYGTVLRAGRNITDRDLKNSPAVVLVNEAFIRKFLSGGNPIGARFSGLAQTPKTVIGVVADAASHHSWA